MISFDRSTGEHEYRVMNKPSGSSAVLHMDFDEIMEIEKVERRVCMPCGGAGGGSGQGARRIVYVCTTANAPAGRTRAGQYLWLRTSTDVIYLIETFLPKAEDKLGGP